MNAGTPAGTDRFMDSTREAIRLARQSSMEFKHTHITPEHLLLGLLKREDVSLDKAFGTARASRTQIRELVLHHIRPGEEGIPEHLVAFSERAKRVIESARLEAQRVRASQMAPEHLLLGLSMVPNTVCSAVLRAVGMTTEVLRETLESSEA